MVELFSIDAYSCAVMARFRVSNIAVDQIANDRRSALLMTASDRIVALERPSIVAQRPH